MNFDLRKSSRLWKWSVALGLIALPSLLYAGRLFLKAAPVIPVATKPFVDAHALPLTAYLAPGAPPAHRMKVGVDADNWSGQARNPAFEQALVDMKVDFVSWHVQPDEETPQHLGELVSLCRKHGWGYLFNTEFGNYKREDARLKHSDGTYRYDLAETTLSLLKDDPLFLGVVYDETDLMQAMNGAKDQDGKVIPPYLVDTHDMTAPAAFDAVSSKVSELQQRYQSYGKRLIFEMTFPDYPFAFARGGALLAPKLLKETSNDLMYSVYRGAALEYHSAELWACADLWFLDRFPMAGKAGPGYHTPAELLNALRFANAAGFDYVYVEMSKGLMDAHYRLTDYGRSVIEFQREREQTPRGDWRTAPINYFVKRFPDGYWGQAYSSFIPDHPYGSWMPNPYRNADKEWFSLLQRLSKGGLPADADTWNALNSPFFKDRPYVSSAGLPLMVVYDHLGKLPDTSTATNIDLCAKDLCPSAR
jgi:hypothetical protein